MSNSKTEMVADYFKDFNILNMVCCIWDNRYKNRTTRVESFLTTNRLVWAKELLLDESSHHFERISKLKISVTVTLKKDVLDPQGKVVEQTLKNMGHKNIENVRQGKFFELEINEDDKNKAKNIVEEICKELLINTVIEDYKINY